VVTLFIEGSREERRHIAEEGGAPGDVERELREHFLVRHYKMDSSFLDLKRAHHMVESGHRAAAWRMVMGHVPRDSGDARLRVLLERTLALWLLYRDGVARACGFEEMTNQPVRKLLRNK